MANAADDRGGHRVWRLAGVLHVGLAISLAMLWLLLSGHYAALLLALGVLSVFACVALAHRMDVIDREGVPIHVSARAVLYWIWLLKEIVLSNLHVVRCILAPRLRIAPTDFVVPASQRTDLGQMIYANSITLTPGTVSMDLDHGTIHVHALTAVTAAGVRSGEMDRRCRELEDGPRLPRPGSGAE